MVPLVKDCQNESVVPAQIISCSLQKSLMERARIGKNDKVCVYCGVDENILGALLVYYNMLMFGIDVYYFNENWENLPSKYYQRIYPSWVRKNTDYSFKNTIVVGAEYTRKVNDAKEAKLLDVRSPSQYDGSDQLYLVNGHIPNAINVFWKQLFTPLSETPLMVSQIFRSTEEIRSLLSSYGFNDPAETIVVYCNSGTEGSAMYFALTKILSFSNVRIFAGSFNLWQNLHQFCPDKYVVVQ